MKNKVKLIVCGVVVVVLLFGGIFAFKHFNKEKKYGTANANTSIEMMNEDYGNSKVTELCSLEEAQKNENPFTYMVENSTFEINDEDVEKQVDSAVQEFEYWAEQSDTTLKSYVQNTYGFESVDDFKTELREEYINFVKERLVAYNVAKQKNITISKDDYNSLVDSYATMFGYEDAETFQTECDKNSIASEMLYDKVVSFVNGTDMTVSTSIGDTDKTENAQSEETENTEQNVSDEETTSSEETEETEETTAESETEQSNDISEE